MESGDRLEIGDKVERCDKQTGRNPRKNDIATNIESSVVRQNWHFGKTETTSLESNASSP